MVFFIAYSFPADQNRDCTKFLESYDCFVPSTSTSRTRYVSLCRGTRASRAVLSLKAKLIGKRCFANALDEKQLRIALIGMSNCGKSFRARGLSLDFGFSTLSVDELIERQIKPELQAMGCYGTEGIAKWMGFPYDPTFQEREARYLMHEERITRGIEVPTGTNFALDTTGSVVYLSKECLAMLRDQFLVVHLEATDDMLDSMREMYFISPKPVVWGSAFSMSAADGGNGEGALRRCYPELLRWRREKYHELADVSVSASVSLSPDIRTGRFMAILKSMLPDD